MATTLPTLTRTIDNAFVQTWYEIRAEAIDNILDANVIWAALRAAGCFKPQTGGEYITRTIRYGKKTAQAVHKGSTMPQGETELKTMARWTWRYIATHCQRSPFDDQKNAGKFKIQSYVEDEVQAAREALEEKFEERTTAAEVTAETGDEVQGLYDIVPTYANRATGTYGAIARSNDWWVPKYKSWSAPMDVEMVSDMTNLYNTISAHKAPPNLIITDQATFELYEDFVMDKTQLVMDSTGSKLADLGFEVLRFKGKPLVWTDGLQSAYDMLMLNTNFIDVVYDPGMWFDMTEWKPVPHQVERVAQFLCALNIVSSQLRRHGMMYAA